MQVMQVREMQVPVDSFVWTARLLSSELVMETSG